METRSTHTVQQTRSGKSRKRKQTEASPESQNWPEKSMDYQDDFLSAILESEINETISEVMRQKSRELEIDIATIVNKTLLASLSTKNHTLRQVLDCSLKNDMEDYENSTNFSTGYGMIYR